MAHSRWGLDLGKAVVGILVLGDDGVEGLACRLLFNLGYCRLGGGGTQRLKEVGGGDLCVNDLRHTVFFNRCWPLACWGDLGVKI